MLATQAHTHSTVPLVTFVAGYGLDARDSVRAIDRLRLADFKATVSQPDLPLARAIMADFISSLVSSAGSVARAMGVAPTADGLKVQVAASALPGLRTASADLAGSVNLSAGPLAPSCPRCQTPMSSGVKIAHNRPVYFCEVDRVVLPMPGGA